MWGAREVVGLEKVWGTREKKQKCIYRVCIEIKAIDKGMVSTLYFRLMACHYQTFIVDQLQKKTNQKLTKNLEARSATPAGSQPPQSKET